MGGFYERLQRSLQYSTWFQLRSHFFRHSKALLQVAHIFGAKPFLIFACLIWLQIMLTQKLLPSHDDVV
jgi:hypothetical protein